MPAVLRKNAGDTATTITFTIPRFGKSGEVKEDHQMIGETVLITGASSGIGWELAKLFAASGSSLILVARNESKLNELKQQLVHQHSTHTDVIVMDLAEVDAAGKLCDEIYRRKLRVDVLVNNAGFGELGSFAKIPIERQVDMIRLNVVTVAHLTRLLLPEMLKHDQGGILNVASVAAFLPGPNMAVYYATKAFVLSFSDALHEELIETNLKVTCLCPGPTETGFAAESGMDSTSLFEASAMDAKEVAKIGFQSFRNNRSVVVTGFKNKLLTFFTRLLPRSAVRKMVKQLQSVEKSD